MKKSTTKTTMFSDAYFQRLYVQNIIAWQQSTINVWNNIELMNKATLTAPKVCIGNENDRSKNFCLDIDEANPNVITVNQMSTNTIISTGVLYDTTFNKPEPALLKISPTFTLPEQQTEAGLYLRFNPLDMLVLTATERVVFEFPSLPTSVKEEYRQVRILNTSNNPIVIHYGGTDVVELFQERVSLVWTQQDGRYTWVYIP